MTSSTESAQARLAASRKALVRHMAGEDEHNGLDDAGRDQAYDAPDSSERSSMWQVLTQALMAWWKHHPAHVALDVGRPFLDNYAREKPLQLIGIAAGAGAAAVLVKPWRLVSITGLALALLRSTKISTTLLALLPGTASKRYPKQTQQSQQFLKDPS
jgi:hypothetical protein